VKITATSLPGVIRIDAAVFTDDRGAFKEVFQQQRYAKAGIHTSFVQANCVQSFRGVLRGLHYQLQKPQGKLVSVSRGEIFDVAVDMRIDSPTYGQWFGEVLHASSGAQIYIPPGFAHGYCVLSDVADVIYQCTDYYHPQSEQTLAWNDKTVAVDWPLTAPILSEKDALGAPLAAAPHYQCQDLDDGQGVVLKEM